MELENPTVVLSHAAVCLLQEFFLRNRMKQVLQANNAWQGRVSKGAPTYGFPKRVPGATA